MALLRKPFCPCHDAATAAVFPGTVSLVTLWGIIALFMAWHASAVWQGGSLWSIPEAVLLRTGANYAPLTWHGQAWRLLTHIFVHGNALHILVNALALWAVWTRSAMVFRTGEQLGIFVLCGMFSGWVAIAQDVQALCMGSSAAIVGLLASVVGWGVGRTGQKESGWPVCMVLGVALAMSGVLPGMGAQAHLAGAGAGLILGMVLSSKSEDYHPAVAALVLAGMTALLLCTAVVFFGPSQAQISQVEREQSAQSTVAFINENDRKVELAMKKLWETPMQADGKESSRRGDYKASWQEQKAWQLRWRRQVVLPLERNAAMAAAQQAQPGDAHFERLLLLREYTTARLEEARFLASGPHQAPMLGESGERLRERIVVLNQRMRAFDAGTLPEQVP